MSGNTRRPTLALKLTDEQRETVERIQRSLSVEEVLDSEGKTCRAEYLTRVSEEEAKILDDAVKAFETFKRQESHEQGFDSVDGPATFSSVTRELDGSQVLTPHNTELSTPLEPHAALSSFVRPGRFLVRVSGETVKTLRQIYEEIIRDTPGEASGVSVDCTIHKDYHKEGLRVAVTGKRTLNNIAVTPSREFRLEGMPQRSNGPAGVDINNGGALTGGRKMAPKERFRKVGFAVIRYLKNRPRKMDQLDFSELWRKRGKTSWLSIILTVVAMGTFFGDLGTDFKVAADHFRAGDYSWGGLTIFLILFPSIVINLVSFLWYVEDEEKTCRQPRGGWKRVITTHFLQLGILERYWQILRQSLKVRRKQKKRNQVVDYKILIAINLDMSLLQMILAFTEDAPQLVLQLYVLIRRRYLEDFEAASLRDLWTIISICFSFFSYSRAVVNYTSWLRTSKRHKGQLRWYGFLSMWLWRSLMFVSRVLALVFFATEFKLWFFVVLATHSVIILAFLGRQEIYFFIGHKWSQFFFRLIIAYIHVFCFFSLDGIHTIKWAIIYYAMTFIENCIFSLLWYTNEHSLLPHTMELSGLVAMYALFFLSIGMMVIYYKVLHPKFKHPSLKWPNVHFKDDKEDESGEFPRNESATTFELWI